MSNPIASDMHKPSIEELRTANYYIRVTQIFFCALYALVVWDWIICLGREYRLVWKKHWTIPSTLYVACRYWILIAMPFVLWINTDDTHTTADCAKLYNLPPLLTMWFQVFAESVLLVRTHVFLGRRPIVLVFLVLCLMAVAGYQLFVGLTQMAPLQFMDAPFNRGPCLPTVRYDGSLHIMGWFLAPLLFDTLVTLMIVAKAVRTRVAKGDKGGILQTFLKEGIYYFLIISFANLLNGIMSTSKDAATSTLFVPLSLVLPDLLACRLILDIREQGNSANEELSQAEVAMLPQWHNKRFGGNNGINYPIPKFGGIEKTVFEQEENDKYHQEMSPISTISRSRSNRRNSPGEGEGIRSSGDTVIP